MRRLGGSFVRDCVLGAAIFSLGSVACVTRDNYLGLDRITGDTSSGDAVDETELEEPPDLRDGGRMPSVPSAMPSEPEPEPDDGSTTDEGGDDPPTSPSKDPETPPPASSAGDGGGFTPPSVVVPLTPSLILPNHFEQVLGVSDDDVTSRIETVFQQLFHGNPDQVIYYELDDDNAYVVDVANGDTRIDALGYGLMFTVQLDHQPEFDKIWHYTKTYFENQAGPLAGYLRWSCEFDGQTCDSQVGVFGAFYVITALLFADARWGKGDGIFDYGAQARALLDVMIDKEELNGGVVDGVTNLFDHKTYLPHFLPIQEDNGIANTGTLMPAFYEVWGAATGEPFWTIAAQASRELLITVAHEATGFPPQRVTHAGEMADPEQDAVFNESSYSYGFNLAVDQAWYGAEPAQVEIADRLIGFFSSRYPSTPYPAIFTRVGMPLNNTPSGALVALNGATAGIATVDGRTRFIRAVWETPTAQGYYRFYDGVNQMLALLYLSGRFRVFE